MTETDIKLNDINPLISNDVFKILLYEFNSIIEEICNNNNLDYTEINSLYSNKISKVGMKIGIKKRNRRILPSNLLCMGRKLDGKQCTRGRRPNSEYCKSHNNKLTYGRIDDNLEIKEKPKKKNKNDEYLVTRVENINGENYLIDDKNFVYSYNLIRPKFLGLKTNSGIKFIEKTF
jgi:hypothetical protein